MGDRRNKQLNEEMQMLQVCPVRLPSSSRHRVCGFHHIVLACAVDHNQAHDDSCHQPQDQAPPAHLSIRHHCRSIQPCGNPVLCVLDRLDLRYTFPRYTHLQSLVNSLDQPCVLVNMYHSNLAFWEFSQVLSVDSPDESSRQDRKCTLID